MTIRLRLTLFFTALLAVVGLAWGAAQIGGLWLTLGHIAESDVQDKVRVVSEYLKDLDAEERRAGRALDLTSFDALPSAFSDDGMVLQLTAPDGSSLNRSPNLGNRRLPRPERSGLARVELRLSNRGGASRALLVTQPLALSGRGVVGWIQVACPIASHERTVVRFAGLAAGGWLLFVGAAFAVSYFFTGRSLAPVAAMTRAVRRMRSTDQNLRLEVDDPPRDEISRLGATFNDLFERLESLLAAKRRFVADASHELRNPLTAILGNLRLIRVRGPAHPGEVLGWVEAAEREAERLARLVERLLVLTQAEEGRLVLERFPVDLAALAREVAVEFGAVHPRVSYRGGAEAVWVRGDRDRLKQVAINLVSNGIRAVRDGGEVWLGAERAGDRARLFVEDTGVGMAPDVLPRIFDRFYRVDAARDRERGGAGLGLSITEALVKEHQGSISVQSAEGRGTRFEVELPLEPPASA